MRRLLPALAAALGAVLLPLTGCSSGADQAPTLGDGPLTEMQARIVANEESRAFALTVCWAENEQSLYAAADNDAGEILLIDVTDGAGKVNLLAESEAATVAGNATSYAMADGELFTIEGTYSSEGQERQFRVDGNCTPKPDA